MTVLELPTPDPSSFDEASRPFAEALAGTYAIKKMIGRGGMGAVYLARDRRLDRLVAVKTLLPQLAADPAVRERFLRETRTAGAMSHPNIVPIHGADEIDGHVFFVMGYVDGDSLAAHVRAHRLLAPRLVAEYLRDVAGALSHAHDRGIIHRDVKAENILIERATGRALVTDFGIARLAEAAPLTATGQLLGTVYYVSPEQVAGDAVDARSDLYSLGVVGFLSLTGRFPFDSEVASAVLVAHVTRPAPAVASINPEVPSALASIVDRCLSKKADDRFASAHELLLALDRAITEVDRASAGRTERPRLVSDTEAHEVWHRAAELQAATGLQPRPEALPRPRDPRRGGTRTSGFQLDQIRSAAAEAGIADRYVEHALAEHGLTNREVPVEIPQRSALWAGVPVEIVIQAEIAGEVDPREFPRLINMLRDHTGRLGVTPARTRELSWRAGGLQLSIVPDQGRTAIRAVDNRRARTLGALLGVVGVAVPLAIGAGFLAAELMAMPGPVGGIRLSTDVQVVAASALAVGAWLMSIPLARKLVRWMRRRRVSEVRELVGDVATRIREAVE